MKVSSIILAATILLIAASVFADPVTFTSNTTIGCGDMMYEGYDVTVSGCELTVVCSHFFNSLTVVSNGTVTHVSGDSQGLDLTIATNVSVSGWCSIHANGRGYGSASGPGAGVTGTEGGGGGAYGGDGGKGCCSASGGIGGYGDIAAPTSLGSGGGNTSSYGQPGGAGGGTIHLVIGGTLTNDGSISAIGINGDGNRSGGGSGGSIYISAASIVGSGTISANGGSTGGWGGGGGGGRIALYYDDFTLSGGVYACGGVGWPVEVGGAGTIYLRDVNDNHVDLYASNCGNGGAYTRLAALPTADDVYIQGSTQVLATNALNVTGNLSVNGATVWTPAEQSLAIAVGGNATVGGWSYLRATGLGYGSASGPGAGATGTEGGGGGAYGGDGGTGCCGTTGGIGGYGNIVIPINLGSGGGNNTSYGHPGGAGGGAIHLVIGGTLTNDGAIDASGVDGVGSRSGGGSGGSIYISAVTIAGSGTVSANGGSTGPWGGGGGGGRIALHYSNFSLSGSITTCGGAGSPTEIGGAGTIYLRDMDDDHVDLYASNCGNNGAYTRLAALPSTSNFFLQGSVKALAISSLNITGNLEIVSATLWTPAEQLLDITVGGNATIGAWSYIRATARGYASASGPGAGATGTGGGGGGAYGGDGGSGCCNAYGGIGGYGDFVVPSSFGSGGGNDTDYGDVGGAGGGAVHFTVGGTLAINGLIDASGADGVGSRSGGGSGGSIHIQATSISGNGTITANGGNTGGWGGGGGGGRIAIYYDAWNFSGNVFVCGGAGWPAEIGGAGTIYEHNTIGNQTDLVTSNCGLTGAFTRMSSPGVVNFFIQGNARVLATSDFDIGGILNVSSNGNLQPQAEHALTVETDGAIVVETSGTITADGLGYTSATGPGAGRTGAQSGGGGGHGGNGGAGSDPGAFGGSLYDFYAWPRMLGSGGGNNTDYGHPGGPGGGALVLRSETMISVNGTITTNGRNGIGDRSGGGAGGSILISTPALEGAGTIQANGGNTGPWGGGGGGGRTAIYTCANSFSGQVVCNPGSGGNPGLAGTVYFGSADVNNNGIPDACDIYNGISTDCNRNGIPDETEISDDATVVTTYYTPAMGLWLYWPCLPGYSQYILYGKHGNLAEVALDTLSGGVYDATSLVNAGTQGDRWTFYVRGYNP